MNNKKQVEVVKRKLTASEKREEEIQRKVPVDCRLCPWVDYSAFAKQKSFQKCVFCNKDF